jgi:DNA repair protein RecN (Recombination protein N)
MIQSLGIDNLGVITHTEVEVGPGLTVVTGETGAGKTMFVTALGLLIGGRADSHAVRAGAKRAVVEGVFDITGMDSVRERVADAGGEADDELIVSRQIVPGGRGRATAGGRTVPMGVLAEVGQELVSMHGQTEQLRLKSTARQRELLDGFGGRELAGLLADYRAAYARWRDLRAEDERLRETSVERAGRINFLESALEAIDAVRPAPGEDAELKALAAKLAAAESLKQSVGTAHASLVGDDFAETENVSDLLGRVAADLERAAADDEALGEPAAQATDLSIRAADLGAELSAYLQGFDDLEGASLQETEERRAQLGSLAAYGPDVEAVLEFEERAGRELLDLRGGDERLGLMQERLSAAEEALRTAADSLHEARVKAAGEFSVSVSEELRALSMPKAKVGFAVEPCEPAAHGADQINLWFTAHEAQAPGEIGRLASGGELSRVMLAIEVVTARRVHFPTFVFDEVDAGVGGAAAIEIGRRLARLSVGRQVIVVTHLAQVAAWADNHITVRKEDGEDGAVSGITRLDGTEREAELARMLGGMSESQAAQAHVVELISQAEEGKSAF